MNYLVKGAVILHAGSPYHLQKKDILIADGIIKKIGDVLEDGSAQIISGNDLCCSIGLFDIGAHCGEPGYESRETMDSLTKAALAGGFTALALFPNNKPVTQTKADVAFLKNHHHRNGVEIHPIAALSKDIKGQDITEYYDLASAGAIGVSDGLHAIQDTGLIGRALQYATTAGLSVIHHPDDRFLSHDGEMHEGTMSTSLGMKGVPDIAELQMLQRDMLVLEYHSGQIIEHAISSARSVSAIEQAKNQKQDIKATVSYMNLLFTDENLSDFDSNLKVLPVLRSENDRAVLIEGVKSSIIDAIVSNHKPLDEESKNLEFTYAQPGATGLETCLPALVDHLADRLGLETIIECLTTSPRKIIGLSVPEIAENAPANLCIFDLNAPWVYDQQTCNSLSVNNPFWGKSFKTRVVRVILGA
jgi:dihydroorotase